METTFFQLNTPDSAFFFHHTRRDASGAYGYIGPEAHQRCELLYLIEGAVTYRIEGRSYDVHPGDMVVIMPEEIHTLRIDGRLPYERMVFLFDPVLLARFLREAGASLTVFTHRPGMPVVPAELCKRFRLGERMTALAESKEELPYRQLDAMAASLELTARLDRVFAARESLPLRPPSVDPLIQKSIDYINAHLSEPLILDDMAKALFISKSTLCHRFRRHMNTTVNRYAALKKIHRAAELLHRGASAAEAARAAGYGNYSTFLYNYKQIFGAAPTAAQNP